MGRRAVGIYLATLAICALSAGWLLNRILSSEIVVEHAEHHGAGSGRFEQICSLILLGVLISSILPRKKKSCCNHEH